MRPFRPLLAALLLVASLTPTIARAAGYGIYEQGAAVIGMAGAGTASVHDASALFFNPAAITQLAGTQVYLGATALQPVISFAGVAPYPGYGVTEEMTRQTFYPPTFYATHRFANAWAVGASLNSPFGLGIEWKEPYQFTGRHIITKADLQTLNGALTAAYAVTPRLSVAGGADLLGAKVKIHKILPPIVIPGGGGATMDVGEVTLSTDYAWAPGWNAAVHFTPCARWKLGAYYRSRVVVHVDNATADFRQIPTGNPVVDAQVAASLPPDQKAQSVLRFPALWSVGAAFLPTPAWTAELDLCLHEWHAFTDLPISFPADPSLSSDAIENYRTGYQARVGAEHRLPAFTYRFGYYYDHAAAPPASVTPLLPDPNRHGASLGLGFGLGKDKRWTLDLVELALFTEQRSTEGVNRDGYDGTYKSFVNIAGVNVGYRW